jgi:hypothetical protein
MLRAALNARQVFFKRLQALTRYSFLGCWQHLRRCMRQSLEIVFDPALLPAD